jgi:hypothetical protein
LNETAPRRKDFKDAIQATASALRIPGIFIEKDY